MTKKPVDPTSPLTEADLVTVRKQRDKHVQFGGAWQSWQRILDVLEDAKMAQDHIAQEIVETPMLDREVARVETWIESRGAA
jgi:hypothetical protein